MSWHELDELATGVVPDTRRMGAVRNTSFVENGTLLLLNSDISFRHQILCALSLKSQGAQ